MFSQFKNKPFTLVAALLLCLVAILHLFRLFFQWEVVVDGALVSQWVSVFGAIIPGLLAFMMWREAGK